MILKESSGVNPHNIQVALLGHKGELAASIQEELNYDPPDLDFDHDATTLESAKVKLLPQPLPAFGLSRSLENLEIRLGRCEYGAYLTQYLRYACARRASNLLIWVHGP